MNTREAGCCDGKSPPFRSLNHPMVLFTLGANRPQVRLDAA
jgi:hypothetical protein